MGGIQHGAQRMAQVVSEHRWEDVVQPDHLVEPIDPSGKLRSDPVQLHEGVDLAADDMSVLDALAGV